MLVYLIPHRLRVYFAKRDTFAKLLNLAALFALACLLFALGLKATEKITWGEAIWQVWQTVTTVGYGNQPATTSGGRVVTMLFGLLGIAVLGALISAWFDWRADHRERKRIGEMDNPFEHGYLVINFPGLAKFAALIAEITAMESDVDICVVDSQLEELPVSTAHLKGARIHFVRGSLLLEDTYKRAGVTRAKSVLIFPQQTGVPESDATTKMVVEIAQRLTPVETRLAHVLVAPENEWLFKGSRSTSVLEIAEIAILVQESRDPFSAVTLQSILHSADGNVARTIAPRTLVGWTWGRFVRACLALGEHSNFFINPLALIHNGTPDPCPSPQATIQGGDRLSIIVHGALDWEKIEAALVRQDMLDTMNSEVTTVLTKYGVEPDSNGMGRLP